MGCIEERVGHSCGDYKASKNVLWDYPGGHPWSSADINVSSMLKVRNEVQTSKAEWSKEDL